MQWLDKIDFLVILILAVILGLLPLFPEPHLWQKLKLLADGELVKPLDIFDLFLHGGPTVLLIAKIFRLVGNKTVN